MARSQKCTPQTEKEYILMENTNILPQEDCLKKKKKKSALHFLLWFVKSCAALRVTVEL